MRSVLPKMIATIYKPLGEASLEGTAVSFRGRTAAVAEVRRRTGAYRSAFTGPVPRRPDVLK